MSHSNPRLYILSPYLKCPITSNGVCQIFPSFSALLHLVWNLRMKNGRSRKRARGKATNVKCPKWERVGYLSHGPATQSPTFANRQFKKSVALSQFFHEVIHSQNIENRKWRFFQYVEMSIFTYYVISTTGEGTVHELIVIWI